MEENKVKVMNVMFEEFQKNPLIKFLRVKKGTDPILRFHLFKLTEIMTRSMEAIAFFMARNEVVQKHEEEQQDILPAQQRPLTIKDPSIVELYNTDSGLEIEKVNIPMQEIPEQFTAEDMANTSWLFNYINGDGANSP